MLVLLMDRRGCEEFDPVRVSLREIVVSLIDSNILGGFEESICCAIQSRLCDLEATCENTTEYGKKARVMVNKYGILQMKTCMGRYLYYTRTGTPLPDPELALTKTKNLMKQ